MTGPSARTDAAVRRRRLRERAAWTVALLGLAVVVTAVVASLFGWSMLIFRSGSMSPDIPSGALAVARPVPVEDVSQGDVVSVVATNGDRITHRVVDVVVGDDGVGRLTLQGDANAVPDQELYRSRTVDRVVASAPLLGYPVAFLLSPVGLVVLGCIALGLVVVAFGGDRRRDGGAGTPGGGHRRRGRSTAVAAGAAVLALGAGSTSGTLAAFSDTATLVSGSYAANPYFTCQGSVTGVGSPYLWWRLDETALGNVADSSGNGRSGVMVNGGNGGIRRGSAACGRDTGGTLNFDGVGAYLGQPDSRTTITGPNVFTAQTWFQTSTNRGGLLMGFGNARTGSSGSHDRQLYMTDTGKLRFGVYTGNPAAVRTIVSGTPYNDGKWHQVTATLSGAGLRLYVDGEVVDEDNRYTAGENFSGYWRVAYDNLSGWTDDPTSDFFAGSLDDVVVYSSALGADQVRASYRAGLTG